MYFYFDFSLTMKQSRRHCSKFGGKIMMMDTDAERERVASLAKGTQCKKHWIALTDVAKARGVLFLGQISRFHDMQKLRQSTGKEELEECSILIDPSVRSEFQNKSMGMQ